MTAETPRCWRGECREACYYADACSEVYLSDEEPQGCDHEWLDRPESDTFECILCGLEGSGFPPGGGPWQQPECERHPAAETGPAGA